MKKIATANFKKQADNDHRFRGAIYVDVYVPGDTDASIADDVAKKQLEEISSKIPNSYVGGVMPWSKLSGSFNELV
jgi:hypothetical protein